MRFYILPFNRISRMCKNVYIYRIIELGFDVDGFQMCVCCYKVTQIEMFRS